MDVDIGVPQFLKTACYIIIFAFLWRSGALVARRMGKDNLAGAMAYLL